MLHGLSSFCWPGGDQVKCAQAYAQVQMQEFLWGAPSLSLNKRLQAISQGTDFDHPVTQEPQPPISNVMLMRKIVTISYKCGMMKPFYSEVCHAQVSD